MATEQFSLRLSKETKAELEELAKATGRSKAFLAQDAIRKYLEIEAWQIRAIQEGIKSAERGELVPEEEVKREWGIE